MYLRHLCSVATFLLYWIALASASLDRSIGRSIIGIRSITVPAVVRNTATSSRVETGFATYSTGSDISFDSRQKDLNQVQYCSTSLAGTLLRGALLRIASDLTGGTAFESVKTRVTTTREGPITAYRNIVKNGYLALWTGSSSRVVEGAFVGAAFMLGSSVTKTRIKAMGGSPTLAALLGGLVGGILQAVVMTPAGMIFTTLNCNHGKPGHERDNAFTVTRRIIQQQGLQGMYAGFGPMALRQATNWASRAGLTEVARTTLQMSQYGVLGEIGSGVIGGLGSCWNTPIESVRVITQRDVGMGVQPKTMTGYWKEILETDGVPGLFRGITPRALQAVWQTIFLVVVPNMMGI